MVIMQLMNPAKVLHYIGNMITVCVTGALLLLPMKIMSSLVTTSPALPLVWFGIIVTFMFFIHWKRVVMLGVPLMSVTWMAYVLFALWIYLN